MIHRIKRWLLNRKIAGYADGGPISQEVLNRIMQINGLNKKLLDMIDGKMISKEDHYKRVDELLAANTATLEKYRSEKRYRLACENEDAQRWRALVSSARLRPLGWAGLDAKIVVKDKNDSYLHFGMEFWTIYGKEHWDGDNIVGQKLLTNYADHIIYTEGKVDLGQPCKGCGSKGFDSSILGPDRCSFCDGTEGGVGP